MFFVTKKKFRALRDSANAGIHHLQSILRDRDKRINEMLQTIQQYEEDLKAGASRDHLFDEVESLNLQLREARTTIAEKSAAYHRVHTQYIQLKALAFPYLYGTPVPPPYLQDWAIPPAAMDQRLRTHTARMGIGEQLAEHSAAKADAWAHCPKGHHMQGAGSVAPNQTKE